MKLHLETVIMFFIKEERGFIMSSIDSAIDLNAGSVSENVKTTLRGELVLAFAVIINSLGVVLMLYSGTGISAISSVCLLYTSPSPRDPKTSRMPSSA